MLPKRCPRTLPVVKLRLVLAKRMKVFVLVFAMFAIVSVFWPSDDVQYIADIQRPCLLPNLNPWDPSILKFVWDLKPIVCDTSPAILHIDDEGVIVYNQTALKLLSLKETDVKCEFKIQLRQPNDDHVTFTYAVPLAPPRQIDADFFHVTCKDGANKKVFDELFSTISKAGNPNAARAKPEAKEELSVLLFAIDSVSRSHAIRKLPKTLKYLKEELRAYDFEGYMNVGSGTYQNVVPLLTGFRGWSNELPSIDFATEPFDVYPFMWKNFSRHGYTTLYAEDFVRAGTFHFGLKGFKDQPTDHYMYPFWQGVDTMDSNTYINYAFEFLENSNVRLKSSSSLCYGRKTKHMLQTEYVKQFYQRYKGLKKFVFSIIGEISHDFVNLVGLADEDFATFLKWMKDNGHLENTIMAFFSDHGPRIAQVRTTDIGRIEHRMPMLYITLPDHIKRKYPDLDKNMQINTKRLSTNYDLHQTLFDVMNQNFKTPGEYSVRDVLRGISLFKPLPEKRSCADAYIPDDICSCYSSTPINVTFPLIPKIANVMLKTLNSILATEPKCAQLELLNIKKARLMSQPQRESGADNSRVSFFQLFKTDDRAPGRYLVAIETIPGHAEFEATADTHPVTDAVTLIGNIDRTSRYGNQSICVSDRVLKPLCLCKNQIVRK